jgi:hypothetical protein
MELLFSRKIRKEWKGKGREKQRTSLKEALFNKLFFLFGAGDQTQGFARGNHVLFPRPTPQPPNQYHKKAK